MMRGSRFRPGLKGAWGLDPRASHDQRQAKATVQDELARQRRAEVDKLTLAEAEKQEIAAHLAEANAGLDPEALVPNGSRA